MESHQPNSEAFHGDPHFDNDMIPHESSQRVSFPNDFDHSNKVSLKKLENELMPNVFDTPLPTPFNASYKCATRQIHRHNKMKRTPTMVNKYCEEMNELNEAANSHPRSALIQSIQQENKHIRELQKENRDMRLVLEEHQNILELIMVKHRDQIRKLMAINKKRSKIPDEKEIYERQIGDQVEKIQEMVAVMRKAAQLNEDEYCQERQLITSLTTENKGLREMLQIAHKSGSIPETIGLDASTQTDLFEFDDRDDISPELHSPNHHLGPMNGIIRDTAS